MKIQWQERPTVEEIYFSQRQFKLKQELYFEISKFKLKNNLQGSGKSPRDEPTENTAAATTDIRNKLIFSEVNL